MKLLLVWKFPHEVVGVPLVKLAGQRLRQHVGTVEMGRHVVQLDAVLGNCLTDVSHTHPQVSRLAVWCRASSFEESNCRLGVGENDGGSLLWIAQLLAVVDDII